MYNLRGEIPDVDISLQGLLEVNLSHNQIDYLCVKDLAYFLQYDGWTRSINLRNNIINE